MDQIFILIESVYKLNQYQNNYIYIFQYWTVSMDVRTETVLSLKALGAYFTKGNLQGQRHYTVSKIIVARKLQIHLGLLRRAHMLIQMSLLCNNYFSIY